jgi:hypothetical protein
MDLIDMNRVFHPATALYEFFLTSHGTFYKIIFYLTLLHEQWVIEEIREESMHT